MATSKGARSSGEPVTIYEVAHEAGVSTATVSRVINDRRHVRAATRQKVEETMRNLGYVANRQARGLAGARSKVIGLLVYELGTSYFNQLIRGIDAATAEIGYDLMLYTTHARRESEAQHAAELASGPVDGLIFVLAVDIDNYVDRLRREGVPFVLLDHDRDVPGSTYVTAANRRGAKGAIDHLIGLGHRRIGFITGTPGTSPARERLAGYRDALRDADIEFDPSLVVKGDFLESRGYGATQELLALDPRPTAIFTSADTAAYGAMMAIRDARLTVPGDVSIVGFDDIPESSLVTPPLTTVRQPLMEMGATAVRLLRRLMDEPETTPRRTELETELVVRGSSAQPPRRRGSPATPRTRRTLADVRR
jgi:LacI family transcriptional regulator